MHKDFSYDRRQLHADLARFVGGEKPQGELRAVSDSIAREEGLAPSSEISAFVRFSSFFSERTVKEAQIRALQANQGSTGGYLISVVLTGFESILRSVLVLGKVGASILSGLSSNVAFPRQVAANSFSYLAEGAPAPDSDQVFGQIAAVPRRFSGNSKFSKQLQRQAPEIQAEQFESFALDCLAESEKAAFQGTGNVQPWGVFNVPNVNSVLFSSSATLATVELFEQKLAQSNVDLSRVCFIMDPLTLAKWRQIARSTNASKYLVDESSSFAGALTVLGYPAYVTQNVPASSIVAGDFSKSTLCFWGTSDDPPVELIIDPYTSKKLELVEVTAVMRQDFVVRRETAFAINSGSTTQ